jgi:hypothetical protein
MNKLRWILAALTVAVIPGSFLLLAQQPPAAGQGRGAAPPPPPMSFFITSVGKGDGANYGGLAGADAYCQQLGTAAGRGAPVTWHAYLSTQGAGAVSARDRIGAGPWYNANGAVVAMNVGQLHGDTVEQARIGNALGKQFSLTEKKERVNGVGDMPNTHDLLTGSQLDGRAFTDNMDHTCNNWTSSGMGSAQVGHSDRQGGGNTSWNSAHASRGCSHADLVGTGGAGLYYCFAIN